jgi:hypothetical protein
VRRAGAAAALALVAAGAGADCVEGGRIATLGVREEHVLLLDEREQPFGLVRVAAADAARIETARTLTRIGGRICDFGLFLIVDGRLVMAREVMAF